PFDAVSLDATEAARFEAAGDASIVLDGPRTFTGPGPVTLEGALQVRDATGTRTVDQLALAEASYEITVQRDPAGTWTVVARLDDHATPCARWRSGRGPPIASDPDGADRDLARCRRRRG